MGIHRSPVDSPHKGQWRGALMFSFICVWTNCWANNRDAGDLRRQCTYYDVTVMWRPGHGDVFRVTGPLEETASVTGGFPSTRAGKFSFPFSLKRILNNQTVDLLVTPWRSSDITVMYIRTAPTPEPILATNSSEVWLNRQRFPLTKWHLKIPSENERSFLFRQTTLSMNEGFQPTYHQFFYTFKNYQNIG